MLGHQRAHGAHRRVRRDMAGKGLEADLAGLPVCAETCRKPRGICAAAIGLEKAELAFEHRFRTVDALGGEARREHAGFRGASEVEFLHLRAAPGLREREQPGGERAG